MPDDCLMDEAVEAVMDAVDQLITERIAQDRSIRNPAVSYNESTRHVALCREQLKEALRALVDAARKGSP
jgi:hypothetical protein